MSANKTTAYIISILLWIASVCVVALSLKMDYEGYIMASQTFMIGAIVVSVWAMTALLAGKG